MTDFKTWEEVKEYLLEDASHTVKYHVWLFSRYAFDCCESCCGDIFMDVEDCMDTIQNFCDDVTELTKGG